VSGIRYSGVDELVLLGDIVTIRIFFRRRKARVVYVPGISKKRTSLEHHELAWVGLQELSGPFLSALVDPKTGRLDKRVLFVERGEVAVLLKDADPFIEKDEIIES
jgi:hypothetical protein